MAEEFTCVFKGKVVKIMIKDKVIFMKSETTGQHLIKLGRPLEMKMNVIKSRNKMPKICMEFINAWKKEESSSKQDVRRQAV